MKKFKAVIFDMDGVIFDSEKLYMQCCIESAEIFGVQDIENTVFSCIGLNTQMTHAFYKKKYGDDFPIEDFWKECTGRFAKKSQDGLLPVKDGARELLVYLKDKKLPTAIASSTRSGIVKRELEAAELISYFDVIVGGDEVEKSKPEPDVFLLAAEKLGFNIKDCAVIEDSINGIKAARASGGFVIMVPDLVQPVEEMKIFTDIIFPSLTEVKSFL